MEPEHSQDGNANSSDKRPRQDEVSKKKDGEAINKVWLELNLRKTVQFPDIMQETPCKNFATVGKFCRSPRCCFKHGGFPGYYSLSDQNVICGVVVDSSTASFSAAVLQSDIDTISGADATPEPATLATAAPKAKTQA